MRERQTDQGSGGMLPSPDTRVVVLGLGNTLMHDEGLGIAALERLADLGTWPDNVTLLDGGVLGLELLPYVEMADAVLLLDAVQTGDPPGSLVRLEGDEIPAVVGLKMSVHQVGFQETLAMSRFRGTYPARLVLWGIVPDVVDLEMSLSDTVEAQMDELVRAAAAELASWSIRPNR